MSWLGLDIGGANLKAADGRGWARSLPFALWREPERLTVTIRELIAAAPPSTHIAATMTGELCDAFQTKVEGVRHITTAAVQAAEGRDVYIYQVDGRLVTASEALESPLLAAASNWHALASFACRFAPCDVGMLIDIGSTTTDIIPLMAGQPRTTGLNDTDRLLAGELVYTGVRRTPICAVAAWLPWRDTHCPVAAELFATMADAYVILGDLPESTDCTSTADGRPLTKEFCRDRFARMICADATMFSSEDAVAAAACVREAQVAQISRAYEKVVTAMRCVPATIVLSGSGEFLARRVLGELAPSARLVSLANCIGPAASECGPAHAVAVLAAAADR
jgi:probable H4MPT-linked C1 transfer pathway protein